MGTFGRRFVGCLGVVSWLLAGVLFYGPYSTWRAGHLDQVVLLV